MDLSFDVVAAEHVFGVKPVMHSTAHPEAVDRGACAQRSAVAVIEFSEGARCTAPSLVVDDGALLSISLVARAPLAPRDVAASRPRGSCSVPLPVPGPGLLFRRLPL